MINYSLKDDGIFYVNFTETVIVNDIKNYLNEFEKLDNLPKSFLALYDLRSADLKISSKDISVIAELADKATGNYLTIRTAFLVDKPNLTAYTILFTQELVPKRTK